MEARSALRQAGLEIRVVEPLLPSGKVTLIAERFADTWTKLALFDFEEYDVSLQSLPSNSGSRKYQAHTWHTLDNPSATRPDRR
jgi:hypothetical protein